MTLAIRASRYHGSRSTTGSTTATPRAALLAQHSRVGQQLMFRPVTGAAVVARPTKTPLSGSRKTYRFSCEVAQSNPSIFTARNSAYYSTQRAPFASHIIAPQGFHRLGCTSLFSRSLSGAKSHWLSASISLSRVSCLSNRAQAFSTSYPAMAATKLDGTAIAKKIREKLAVEIVEKQKTNPNYKPCLKIIQGLHFLPMLWSSSYTNPSLVGDRSDSCT